MDRFHITKNQDQQNSDSLNFVLALDKEKQVAAQKLNEAYNNEQITLEELETKTEQALKAKALNDLNSIMKGICSFSREIEKIDLTEKTVSNKKISSPDSTISSCSNLPSSNYQKQIPLTANVDQNNIHNRKEKTSFTLTEFLVVVLIIGILSSVAFISYGKQNEEAYKSGNIIILKDINNLSKEMTLPYKKKLSLNKLVAELQKQTATGQLEPYTGQTEKQLITVSQSDSKNTQIFCRTPRLPNDAVSGCVSTETIGNWSYDNTSEGKTIVEARCNIIKKLKKDKMKC